MAAPFVGCFVCGGDGGGLPRYMEEDLLEEGLLAPPRLLEWFRIFGFRINIFTQGVVSSLVLVSRYLLVVLLPFW